MVEKHTMNGSAQRRTPSRALSVLVAASLVLAYNQGRSMTATTCGEEAKREIHPPRTTPPPPPPHRTAEAPSWRDLTWIGNAWIPPPGARPYSAAEIRGLFRRHSVLWVGDSTARRAYGTLFGILAANASESPHVPVRGVDGPAVIDVNRKKRTEVCRGEYASLCRPMPGGAAGGGYDYLDRGCFHEVAELADLHASGANDLTGRYSLIIVAMGVHEIVVERNGIRVMNPCARPGTGAFPGGTYARLGEAIRALGRVQSSSLAVVWRTGGFYEGNAFGNEVMREINRRAVDQIDDFNADNTGSNLSYVDWGSAILPRSEGDDRIAGDIRAHYGLEARLLLVQMLANHLDRI